MALEKRQKSIDLDHHISDFARSRENSPLKGLQKYFKPGSIMLAGGLPSPAYFPFSDISGEVLDQASFSLTASEPSSTFSWLWNLFGNSKEKEKTATITIPKYPTSPSDLCLSTALQYMPATGIPQMQKIMYEFSAKVYKPAYTDFTTLIHTGNTDGWNRAVATFCNKGEMILASEWTYPSAMFTSLPFGVTVAPVALDSEGMCADDLLAVLENWDEHARGAPRPHVMYIVPIGQNPSGATMGAARKQKIYDICVKYDVIIVEDDPYFFLQEGPYDPKAQRKLSKVDSDSDYLRKLSPSFLKFDYQGRVIRMDTFSKTVAPGCRLGWFTCNPVFAQRLELQGETSTQSPCGFGQALVAQLLTHWKHEGYIRWLRGLGMQYKTRRDHLVDILHEEFDLQISPARDGIWKGADVYTAYQKVSGVDIGEKFNRKEMFSFVPPTSGMFIWIKLHLESLTPDQGNEESLEVQLWTKIAEAGVLLAPGWIFSANVLSGDGPADGEGHFRISFSNTELGEMKEGIQIFANVIRDFFGTH